MADARIFGFFSILLGGTIVVLSSFLGAMPGFLIAGMLMGAAILLSGAAIVTTFLLAKYCPECGEILSDACYECPVCGHQVSNEITASLVRRFFH